MGSMARLGTDGDLSFYPFPENVDRDFNDAVHRLIGGCDIYEVVQLANVFQQYVPGIVALVDEEALIKETAPPINGVGTALTIGKFIGDALLGNMVLVRVWKDRHNRFEFLPLSTADENDLKRLVDRLKRIPALTGPDVVYEKGKKDGC